MIKYVSDWRYSIPATAGIAYVYFTWQEYGTKPKSSNAIRNAIFVTILVSLVTYLGKMTDVGSIDEAIRIAPADF